MRKEHFCPEILIKVIITFEINLLTVIPTSWKFVWVYFTKAVWVSLFWNNIHLDLVKLVACQSIVACKYVCIWWMRDSQERGVQWTDCSAWRWELCYKESPALLRQNHPSAAEHTDLSHQHRHTHTGHFHGTLMGRVGEMEKSSQKKETRYFKTLIFAFRG